jgi:CheY-like chemotaxis protein
MPTVLLLADDLLDSSRVSGSVRARGGTMRTARDWTRLAALALESNPALVFLDLANPGLKLDELLSALHQLTNRPLVIAFGSHVDAQGLQAARAAGCDLVLPRSAFVERLETELPSWLEGKS